MTTPACLGNPHPYDVLIEETRGPGFDRALPKARAMCGACPIWEACLLRDNREEDWARAVIGVRKPVVTRDLCGTTSGANAHYKRREQVCEPCKAANRARPRKPRDRRKRVAA